MKKIFLESKNGYFGEGDTSFGGCFIPEILYPALNELQQAYNTIFKSKEFKQELKSYLKTFVGRPTPLIYAKNASEALGNEIYLKFEGLANTGAHKINNALAQVLLAKKMNKKHVIAETGAGQHGVAVSSVCAFLKIPCTIFMGETDVNRQRPNVFIMEQFGAKVVSVASGTKTLKDAVNEALRQWSKEPINSFYVLGSALGPYPYPDIVRESQKIIGKEIKKKMLRTLMALPDYVVACVGGGSNAMGAFSAFLQDTEVNLVGVEAGGDDFLQDRNAMRLSPKSDASIGIAHGYKSYFLQDKFGQLANTHSISAGLDYGGVGPQLAHLSHIGRVTFMAASDLEALEAMQFFARHEGILPALESSHALAGAIALSKTIKNKIIVVNVSGRGDKDIFITAKELYTQQWRDFLESELQSVEKKLKKSMKKAQMPEAIDNETQDSYYLDENLVSYKNRDSKDTSIDEALQSSSISDSPLVDMLEPSKSLMPNKDEISSMQDSNKDATISQEYHDENAMLNLDFMNDYYREIKELILQSPTMPHNNIEILGVQMPHYEMPPKSDEATPSLELDPTMMLATPQDNAMYMDSKASQEVLEAEPLKQEFALNDSNALDCDNTTPSLTSTHIESQNLESILSNSCETQINETLDSNRDDMDKLGALNDNNCSEATQLLDNQSLMNIMHDDLSYSDDSYLSQETINIQDSLDNEDFNTLLSKQDSFTNPMNGDVSQNINMLTQKDENTGSHAKELLDSSTNDGLLDSCLMQNEEDLNDKIEDCPPSSDVPSTQENAIFSNSDLAMMHSKLKNTDFLDNEKDVIRDITENKKDEIDSLLQELESPLPLQSKVLQNDMLESHQNTCDDMAIMQDTLDSNTPTLEVDNDINPKYEDILPISEQTRNEESSIIANAMPSDSISQLHANSTSLRVFETDPKFSKIIGKSLKS